MKSTNGDTFLGGEDFDQRIIDWLIQEFQGETQIDLKQDRMALQRLKEAAEKAKIQLSRDESAEIMIDFLCTDDRGEPVEFEYELKREDIERGRIILDDLGNEIHLSFDYFENRFDREVDEVYLSGGASLLPLLDGQVEHAGPVEILAGRAHLVVVQVSGD